MRRKVPLTTIFAGVAFTSLLLWFSRDLWATGRAFLRSAKNTTTEATELEESTYVFAGPQAENKVVVIPKMESENVDWLSELPDWQHAVYHMDNPNWILHPPMNKGREAMAYLTFIISHYYVLPEVIVFLHPHRNGWPLAWHTDAKDYDNVNSLRSLRLEYVREHGYANMRCIQIPGCPDEIQPFRQDEERQHEIAFADAYTYMFGGNHSSVPHQVGAACCAQFAVSAAQVLTKPREDYVRYRKWLIDTTLDSETSGRVLEYMWHMIFGKEAVWCPDLNHCWCEQFGRC